MDEKLYPIYKLLRASTPTKVRENVKKTCNSVNKMLSEIPELALNPAVSRKNFVPMPGASFSTVGDALIFDNNPGQKTQSKRKIYALVILGLKTFCPLQLKT